MDPTAILDRVKNAPGEKVKLALTDIDGVLRGKIIHKEKFFSIIERGFGFCDVVFGWDIADVSYENGQFTGWHTGYPDTNAQIVVESFREIPWEDNIPFFLAELAAPDGTPTPVCPRQLLKSVIQDAEEMGFHPVLAQEFEWFNFDETPETWAEKNGIAPEPLTPGMFGYSVLRSSQKSDFFQDLFELLLDFKVPLEGIHTETGPGVYEAAIRYSDALEAGDRAVLFKTAVKEIASRHGIMASFMAKWREDLPGCSGHVHQSMWNLEKTTNLFYDEKGVSPLFKSYIAGQLACLPILLPMWAPTVNSYKRLVEGAWAPTTCTWGMDNRTVALRALTGGKSSTRLETRVVGSDVNPYLAMAACLAAGLYGIREELTLNQEATQGNGYTDTRFGTLPSNLWEATQKMKQSELASELLGEAFVDHFVRTREWEWKQYMKAITDWERQRYFELI